MINTRKRLASIFVAAALTVGGATVMATPASAASAAATAFNNCVTPYVNAANKIGAIDTDAQKAVLYTGYQKCYYELSQRSDISGQQEIDAINNFNSYYAKASTYIAKTGVKVYDKFISDYKLVGMRL